MKMLKKIFKNVGKADKNIWGYVMLQSIYIPHLK